MFETIFPSWVKHLNIQIYPVEALFQLDDNVIVLSIIHVLFAWTMMIMDLLVKTHACLHV